MPLTPTPNLSGFADAQRRLRQELGRVVTFYTPLQPNFSPSLASGKFDPETHLPYDPVTEPSSYGNASAASGYSTASAQCSVVFQPLATIRRGSVQADHLGIRDRSTKDLIADVGDHAVFKNATRFELDGELWKIELIKADGIGAKQRYVIFGEAIQ